MRENLLKNRKIGIILSVCYLTTVFFFYYMTLQSGNDSSEQSSFVTDLFIKVISIFKNDWKYDYDVVHNIIRKVVGHFGYSAFMGILGFLSWYFLRLKISESVLINLIVGLFIASTSELLQLIPNDRGPSFGDLFINYTGYFFGVITILFIVKSVLKNK